MSRKYKKNKHKKLKYKKIELPIERPIEQLKGVGVDPDKLIDLLVEPTNQTKIVPEDSPGVSLIDKEKGIVLPKGGGIESYLEGQAQPFPGYPDNKIVFMVDVVKRTFKTLVESFNLLMKKHKILKFMLFKRNVEDLITKWLNLASYSIRNYRLRPVLYSHAVREIYRVFTIAIERDSRLGMKRRFTQIRDLLCMVAEFDSVYRFILQDILSEIDIEKIKLDEKDLHYASKTKDYDFGGKKAKNDKV